MTTVERARVAAVLAAVLGGAHAAVSLMWLVGSTWLLDTVGGTMAELGRERTLAAIAGLAIVVLAKAAIAVSGLWFAGWGRNRWARLVRTRHGRTIGWLVGAGLLLYGAVLTLGGAVALSGVVDLGEIDDRRALRWHTLLWDPWFALWGAALLATLALTRNRDEPPAPEPGAGGQRVSR